MVSPSPKRLELEKPKNLASLAPALLKTAPEPLKQKKKKTSSALRSCFGEVGADAVPNKKVLHTSS